jgi:tripartite-type tricarboxylate transporter receptor subunit TctC
MEIDHRATQFFCSNARLWWSAALATMALVTAIATASAQTYPTRPIRLIVPFAAGGGNDIVARLIQPDLEKALGQRLVNPAVTVKLPYDTERDLAPIVLVGKSPLLFSVNPKVPARTLGEFVALARANPGKFNYGTPGANSQAHLLLALWSGLAGIRMQHVPYRGAAPAIAGTIAGEVECTLISTLASLPQVNAGTLRALATGSAERDPHLPDLPTIAESGFPGFEAVAWAGLFTTAGTPPAILRQLNAEVNRIIDAPAMAMRFEEQGMVPAGGSPEEFGAFISRELARWKDAARAAGVAP